MMNMNAMGQGNPNMQHHSSYNWGGVMGFLQD